MQQASFTERQIRVVFYLINGVKRTPGLKSKVQIG